MPFKKILLYFWLPLASLSLFWHVFLLVFTPAPDLDSLVWKQSDESLYNGQGPYMVRVRVDHHTFHPLMLSFVPVYTIAVTHVKNPDYGHVSAIDFDDSDIDGIKGIRRTKVAFSNEGVTLTQPRGKSLFIPAAYFLGGR